MNQYALVSAIRKGIWAIDSDYAEGRESFVYDLLYNNNMAFEFTPKSQTPILITAASGRPVAAASALGSVPKGSVAILPVKGELLKYDTMCNYGMQSIASWVNEAKANPNITGIVLDIDSPGGTVDGVMELAYNLISCSKPIVSYVNGMMCSGAAWIGACGKYVMAENKHSQVGSVGVMMASRDSKPYYEKQGFKYHTLKAPQSFDKNATSEEVDKGEYDKYINTILKPLADDFINHMKTMRPGIDESMLHGRVVFADEGVTTKFIDSLGSLQQAVEKVKELAGNSASVSAKDNLPNSNSIHMKKYPFIQSALGVELEVTAEGVFLTPEQLEAIDTSGATANQARDTANESLTTAQADLANAQSKSTADLDKATNTISERDTRITELENQVEALKKGAGSKAGSITPGAESTGSSVDDALEYAKANPTDTVGIMERFAKQ